MNPDEKQAPTVADEVPWPEDWLEESRRRIVVGTLMLTVLVLACVFGSYKRWGDESYGQSIALGFLAVIGAAWLRFVVASKLRDRWKPLDKLQTGEVPDVEEPGVVFEYAPAIYRVYWTSLIVVILLSGGIAGGLIALGVQDDFSWYSYLEILVMILLTLYGLRFLLEFARRQVRPGLVGLTPRGVYHRSWTFSGFIPWEHVESVAAIDVSGPVVLVSAREEDFVTPVQQTSKIWKQGELALLPDLAIRSKWITVDAAVFYHAVLYYFVNTGARPELATDAGAARIREQRLHTDPEPRPVLKGSAAEPPAVPAEGEKPAADPDPPAEA